MVRNAFVSYPEKIPQYLKDLRVCRLQYLHDIIGYFGHTFSDAVLRQIIESPDLLSLAEEDWMSGKILSLFNENETVEGFDEYTIVLRLALRHGNIDLAKRIQQMTTFTEEQIKQNMTYSQSHHPEQSRVLWGVPFYEPRPIPDAKDCFGILKSL